MNASTRALPARWGLALAVALGCTMPLYAADHSDTALLNSMSRQNAELTDFHAFVRDGNLILAASTNPAIPVSAGSYQFPADLTVRFHVDNDSEVSFDDPDDLARYGGTIVRPDEISDDIVFIVTFDETGVAKLTIEGGHHGNDDDEDDDEDDDTHVAAQHGLGRLWHGASNARSTFQAVSQDESDEPGLHPSQVELFAGLRDDPFIRCPRHGRNVGAIILSVPLHRVVDDQSTLLMWVTTDIDDVFGSSEEIAGRSLRSMFPENDMANVYPPRSHQSALGMAPDVMIYDTSKPAAFPNGRELLDDVVAIVADPRVVNTCPPLPNGNDLPFLPTFPFFAPPHPPVN